MLLVRLGVNNRLLVVNFLESQKLHMDLLLLWGSTPLTPVLFKGKIYAFFNFNLHKKETKARREIEQLAGKVVEVGFQ